MILADALQAACRFGSITVMFGGVLLSSSLPAAAQHRETKLGTTGWTLVADADGGKVFSCGVSRRASDFEFKVAIGERGGLAIVLEDPYLDNQLASVGLWKAGARYSATVFIGKDAPVSTDANQAGQHSVIVQLPYSARPQISRASNIAVNLNGLAMRGYAVPGVGKALDAVIACARTNGLIAN